MKKLSEYTLSDLKVLQDAFWDLWNEETLKNDCDWGFADDIKKAADMVKEERNRRAREIYKAL